MLTHADEDRSPLDEFDNLDAQAVEAAVSIAGLKYVPAPTREEAAQAALAADIAVERLAELEAQLDR